MRFRDREIGKETFYAAKTPIQIWDVNVDNIAILKFVKTKSNSIGYFDKTIRLLVLVMPKMSGYNRTFKVKEEKNYLMSFRIDNEKLLENYKAISTKIEELKGTKLNA